MPRGASLTEIERQRILDFHGQNMSARAIAEKLERHHSTVSSFLKSPATYGSVKRLGPKPRMTPRAVRHLVTEAAKGQTSARRLKQEQSIPVGVRRTQQILRSTPFLNWEMRKPVPWMTQAHKKARDDWAMKQVSTARDWTSVIFSDEKKFNLDGPDGIQYYWRDLRKEPQYFKKRQSGGGSVMVWGAFGGQGKTSIAFLDGTQDSVKYCATLQDFLLPVAADIAGPNWVFQQDNAAIHTSKHTKAWFESNNVRVLPWPARSPDLNPIENVWGIMVRRIYQDGRCYNSVSELKSAITKTWNEMTQDELEPLWTSMNKRCMEIARKKGNSIDY